MMTAVLLYLVRRFFYRIIEFLRHWYIKSARTYSNFVLDRLQSIDYYLAWRITLKNLFQPLYKDYSIVGYALGFAFRSARLLGGAFVYGIFFGLAIFFYLVWLLIPVFILMRVLSF